MMDWHAYRHASDEHDESMTVPPAPGTESLMVLLCMYMYEQYMYYQYYSQAQATFKNGL